MWFILNKIKQTNSASLHDPDPPGAPQKNFLETMLGKEENLRYKKLQSAGVPWQMRILERIKARITGL
jgi:hypothetical protein